MDTQWPRYEVFEQERPDQPHRNTGAVHAPDAEMALQNARDVFVRRPEVCSLWVVPENQIYAWTTAALLADPGWQSDTVVLARKASDYEVFQKQTQRQSETYVTHVGTVEARSPSEALREALAKFDTGSVFVWWVVPGPRHPAQHTRRRRQHVRASPRQDLSTTKRISCPDPDARQRGDRCHGERCGRNGLRQ